MQPSLWTVITTVLATIQIRPPWTQIAMQLHVLLLQELAQEQVLKQALVQAQAQAQAEERLQEQLQEQVQQQQLQEQDQEQLRPLLGLWLLQRLQAHLVHWSRL